MTGLPSGDEQPPPPLLLPAVRELSRFGWTWTALGALLIAAALTSGSTAELDAGQLTLVLILFGLTVASVLGGLMLARRTGPKILYYRILDHAPPPPAGVPRELAGATTRRVIPPAGSAVLALCLAALVAAAIALTVGGEPREELRRDLPAATLLIAGGWTLTCGAAGLRMASWFSGWERLRRGLVLCQPLRAGHMRPVYYVERAQDTIAA